MELRTDPGTYALILRCDAAACCRAGRLGTLQLVPGWYVYVGSAFGPGGVRARCLRHLRGGRPHWHIDHLRPLCRLEAIWYSHDPLHREHDWASLVSRLRGAAEPFPGFGATDCTCRTHLFLFQDAPPSYPAFSARVRREMPDHGPVAWLAAEDGERAGDPSE